jgi:hypothetical protein
MFEIWVVAMYILGCWTLGWNIGRALAWVHNKIKGT